MTELLIIVVFIGALGVGTWLIEGPICRRYREWRNRDETIADAQTTSERDLWR